MIAVITYFDLRGSKLKTVSVDGREMLELGYELIFPGDFIAAIIKIKENDESLPKIEGTKYHILIEVTSQEFQMTKLIPYDYIEEMEKIRRMSSKDIETFIK